MKTKSLEREHKHKNGKTGYHHAMLSAVLVHPEEKEVFVMDNEPIIGQDGSSKNDCEPAIPGLAKIVEGAYFCYYGLDCKKS
jgi:hypothetical protein